MAGVIGQEGRLRLPRRQGSLHRMSFLFLQAGLAAAALAAAASDIGGDGEEKGGGGGGAQDKRLQGELLDPSLVYSFQLPFSPTGNESLRLRAVRMLTAEREVKCHVDLYNLTDGSLLSMPDNFEDAVAAMVVHRTLPSEQQMDEWSDMDLRTERWKFGEYPGVHCQADELLSIADEIRSGRFVRNLFRVLYNHASHLHTWTRQGVNLGAGIGEASEDDPLEQWTLDLASKVVLVDSSRERLQLAAERLERQAGGEFRAWIPLVGLATPFSLEWGSLGHYISEEVGPKVDVVKVDIDSYDCQVLQALLLRMEASVLVLESQPLIPPPIKFARLFHPEDPLEQGLVGCSLSYQLRMLQPNYRLLVYTEHDAVFVHLNLTSTLEGLPSYAIFGWTRYTLRFPVDEFDCFRRSRMAPDLRWADTRRQEVPVEYLREWALTLCPTEALSRIWGNLSELSAAAEGGPADRRIIYSLDA